MQNKPNKLIQYIEILDEWNEKFNLVSYRTIPELIIDHIIDSLSLLEISDFKKSTIFDIGTGPGLPGIVLAILFPINKFILIEPQKKYYRFLKKVIEKLNLNNVSLLNEKVENLQELEEHGIFVSRAVGDINYFINLQNIKHSNLMIFYQGMKIFEKLAFIGNKFKIVFIKKIILLEKYNKNHYIVALRKKQ